jgi:hypothetical protein
MASVRDGWVARRLQPTARVAAAAPGLAGGSRGGLRHRWWRRRWRPAARACGLRRELGRVARDQVRVRRVPLFVSVLVEADLAENMDTSGF